MRKYTWSGGWGFTGENMKKKKWYIVKHKKEKQWTAYELTKEEASNVIKGYMIKGPYETIIKALLASNS